MKVKSNSYTIQIGMLAIILMASGSVFAETLAHHGHQVDMTIDAYTCITCHDGLIGSEVPFCTVKCNVRTSHSVMKSYPPAGKEDLYASVEDIEMKGIPLFEGKVVCQSCHDLRNPGKNHLVVKSQDQNLCTTCHTVLR